jgi:hypothetical protein
MRFTFALALSLLALPMAAHAELNFTGLIDNRDIQMGNDLVPVVLSNNKQYNIDYRKNPKVVEDKSANPNYRLRVETAKNGNGFHVDEIGQGTTPGAEVDMTRQGMQTAHLDEHKKLVSHTICAGQFNKYQISKERNLGACLTVTPELCRGIEKVGNGQPLAALKQQSMTCAATANSLRGVFAKLIDDKFRKEESTNINRLRELSRASADRFAVFDLSAPEAGSSPIGNSVTGKLAQKTSARMEEKGDDAIATFLQLARLSSECEKKARFFPEETAAAGAELRSQQPMPNPMGTGAGMRGNVTE